MVGTSRDTTITNSTTDAMRLAAVPTKTSNGQRSGEESSAVTESWRIRIQRSLLRYPIPLVALTLLLLSAVLWLTGLSVLAQWGLLAIIVMGGAPLLWETAHQLLHREFGVDLIAVLAIVGSVLLHQYLAGAIVVLMLSGGEALEAYALQRARRSLSALAERAPRTAHIWLEDQLVDIPATSVEPGSRIVVKPGELIPVDGVVSGGTSSVSEADLTGEPVPVTKEIGGLVMSGSVNLDRILEVRATRRSAESQYAQIVRLVEEAQRQRAPIHRLADRYGAWFTLVAVGMAAAAWLLSGDSLFALAVLVVATPCPLILATPIAIMTGIDVAARQGLIVKSGATIEQLGAVDVAIFDKTGTLTLGTPRVVGALPCAADGCPASGIYDASTLLRLVASAEQFSAHILARAAVAAAQERTLSLLPATAFEETLGKGIRARVDRSTDVVNRSQEHESSIEVAIGNRTFMRSLDIALPKPLLTDREQRTARGQIVSFIALDRQIVGLLVFADVPRPDLARLVPELKAAGITQTVLLTGDGATVAQQIGRTAGIDRVVAHCLPAQKVEVVKGLQAQGHSVLMVGDGINDAPALAAASVGLALGAHGLSATSAVADAILLSTDILKVPAALCLGRRVMRVAIQGIWIGMGLSLLAMVFAALGFIPPAAGAILQEGIDVLVILNALRAGRSGITR
ncbi:MAG TPA: heavy metal translocating P-type ATPase [Ktedonobacterales bacterium]|nr:heavy metal translocating P-type ATPase [Ktedonobacterales bacterium]